MPHSIQAQVEEAACVPRRSYPLTHGCPFPQGVLKDPGSVRLTTAEGDELPLQTSVLATWPDGSVKWLLLDAQVDLRARQILPVRIEYGKGVVRKEVASPLRATRTEGGLRVETGGLTVALNASGPALFAQAQDCLAQGDSWQMRVMDEEGRVYTGRVEGLEVEEQNALRLVVRACGGFVSEDGVRPMSWDIRLYFFAHQPFVKMYHTFVHDQDEPIFFRMREMRFSLPIAIQGPPRVMLGSPHATTHVGEDFGSQDGEVRLWENDFEQYSIFGLSSGRIDRRTKSHGWVYAGDETKGVQLKLRNPSQNYPKIYATDGARIEVHLYPDAGRWTPPENRARRYTELDLKHDGEYEGALQVPQGMAKTDEVFLYFGPAAGDAVDAATWATAWQHPLLLEIDSRAFADSGALGTFPRYYPEYWLLEEQLRAGADGSLLVGMMNFGDTGRVAAEGDRQVTYTVDNVAYDHTRSVIRQYVRTGYQHLFWKAEAMAFHLMDVDTIHHSSEHPERVGAPHMQWSQFHHYSDTDRSRLSSPNTSHTWFGGILDYYFLTGYRRALEIAQVTGSYCARTPTLNYDITPEIRERWDDPRQRWPYCTRTSGWALNGMAELYEVTRDQALREPIGQMVAMFERWQDADGRWRNIIGSFGRGATPFMISGILNGLMRTYELLGDEKAREMCIKGCRFLAGTMVNKEGLVFYKEAPVSCTGPHSSAILNFRPMAFAYAQTKDPAILRFMWRLFRWRVEGGGPTGYEIKDALWALPTFEAAGLLEVWQNEKPFDAEIGEIEAEIKGPKRKS